MIDETAIVDCLEARPAPAGPRRWFLFSAKGAGNLSDLGWSAEESHATRFDRATVEALTSKTGRGALPMLSVDPPIVPIFPRAIYGREVPPAESIFRESPQVTAPDPETQVERSLEPERERRPGDPPRPRRYRAATPEDAYSNLERRGLA